MKVCYPTYAIHKGTTRSALKNNIFWHSHTKNSDRFEVVPTFVSQQ